MLNVNMVKLNVSDNVDRDKFSPDCFMEPIGAFLNGLEQLGISQLPYLPKDHVAAVINLRDEDGGEVTHFKLSIYRDLGDSLFQLDLEHITNEEAMAIRKKKEEEEGAFCVEQDLNTDDVKVSRNKVLLSKNNKTVH